METKTEGEEPALAPAGLLPLPRAPSHPAWKPRQPHTCLLRQYPARPPSRDADARSHHNHPWWRLRPALNRDAEHAASSLPTRAGGATDHRLSQDHGRA